MKAPSAVTLKYRMYNSLFLQLPFEGIEETGARLAVFTQACQAGLEAGMNPAEIVESFLQVGDGKITETHFDLLFRFIQYAERQVVLFDSIEDASFAETHDLDGKGSVKHLLNRLGEDGLRQKLQEKLTTYAVRIVLTAHPTQFYPGKVLGILHDLGNTIHSGEVESLHELLMQLGKTAFVNRARPTPLDEAVSLNWYLANIFYEALPTSVHHLITGLGMDVLAFPHPEMVRLGFWPGGDRDGNPFVTSSITLEVAALLRRSILSCYYRDIKKLRRRFTFNGIEDTMARMEAKLYHTLYHPEREGYSSAQGLLLDLEEARRQLLDDHQGLFLHILDRFWLKVKLFGFYFASLDIRQESGYHRQMLQPLLNRLERRYPTLFSYSGYLQYDVQKQMDFLLSWKDNLEEEDFEEEGVREMIRTFRAIASIQEVNGEEGCHRYIISNCGSALEVAEVLTLARLCMGNESDPPLDIVPLFETVEDLATADTTMETLYRHPKYAAHLGKRGHKQTIMLGFSDGTKDGGYLRANWSIYRAKEALTRISRQYGISVVFFDGRGGPPGRGGGNNAGYYAAHGSDIENREIQVTIQGQTVSSTYGTVEAAMYNLEQLFTAGLEQVLSPGNQDMRNEDKALMDELAEIAYQGYLALKNHPDFVAYLEQMTPLKWYGDTNIASRPTRRNSDKKGLDFKDLRAIPFVGAWAQMKQNVPGYFSFGHAMETTMQAGRMGELRALFHHSGFFRALVENSMQSLSKANFMLTRHLAAHPRFGAFWQLLYDEYQRTRMNLLQVSEEQELLARNPVSKESIMIREDIVLPLIVIQQFAIQKMNESSESDDRMRKLVLRAMFGIINAGRNVA